MWRDYFKLKGLKPGRVITELCGEIDFSRDNIPVEIIRKLYENDFPYLEITPLGKKQLYGIEVKVECQNLNIKAIPDPEKRKERKKHKSVNQSLGDASLRSA